jgi:hypothetical protein
MLLHTHNVHLNIMISFLNKQTHIYTTNLLTETLTIKCKLNEGQKENVVPVTSTPKIRVGNLRKIYQVEIRFCVVLYS